MKKIFLTAFIAFCATSLAAQELQSMSSMDKQAGIFSVEAEPTLWNLEELRATSLETSKRHAKSNGVYYAKPTGSVYNTDMGSDGSIASYRWLALPAWYEGTFVNKSTYPTECSWSQYLVQGYGSVTGPYDLSSLVDDNGDLSLSLSPGYALSGGPFVEYGGISYALGFGDNIYWPPYVAAYSDFSWLAFLDNYTHSYFSTSGLSTFYCLGTGNYTGPMTGIDNATGQRTYISSGTYTSSGVYQMFPAPIAPMYVRNIYIESVVFSRNLSFEPIKNNAVITLDIYDTEAEELLYTLTATTGDYIAMNNYWSWNGVTYLTGVLKFSLKGYDEVLGETEEPFVIDRAITVDVHGFEDTDNIELGLAMNAIADCDEEAEFYSSGSPRGAIPMFVDPTNAITPLPTIAYSMGLAVRFDALMDRVFVADTLTWSNVITGEQTTMSGYNTLCISAEGDVCTNDISDPSFDLGALYVNTNCSWFSDDGSENYSFTDELPEWLTAVNVDTSNYSVENERYYNLVSFTAAPNYDEEERTFTTYVQGRGYADTTLVTIRQEGGAEVPEGISSVSADVESNGAVYNIAGQRVSQTSKGILIKDGRKVINK